MANFNVIQRGFSVNMVSNDWVIDEKSNHSGWAFLPLLVWQRWVMVREDHSRTQTFHSSTRPAHHRQNTSKTQGQGNLFAYIIAYIICTSVPSSVVTKCREFRSHIRTEMNYLKSELCKTKKLRCDRLRELSCEAFLLEKRKERKHNLYTMMISLGNCTSF